MTDNKGEVKLNKPTIGSTTKALLIHIIYMKQREDAATTTILQQRQQLTVKEQR